jgi:hypothetical protein
VTYFECESCRARLYSSVRQDRLVRDICPSCGAALRAVAELTEVAGYRSIPARRGPIRLGASDRFDRAAAPRSLSSR